MTPKPGKDRRIVTGRRSSDGCAQRTDKATVIVQIVGPEERAAQVERIYERIPYAKRQCLGINYEMVRAVLDALRD